MQGTIYFILSGIALLNYVAYGVTNWHSFLYLAVAFTMTLGIYMGLFRTQIRKQFNIRVCICVHGFLYSFVSDMLCAWHVYCPILLSPLHLRCFSAYPIPTTVVPSYPTGSSRFTWAHCCQFCFRGRYDLLPHWNILAVLAFQPYILAFLFWNI